MTNKYKWTEEDNWQWLYAEHSNIPDIVNMAQTQFQMEIDQIFKPQPEYYAYNLDLAITHQRHNKSREQLLVATNRETNKLMAYGWIGRGTFTTYAYEEVAEAKFAHCDLALPVRTRIRLIAQLIQEWIIWCEWNNIPVLVSTSIRDNQKGFMRLHEELGFKVKGSMAYYKVQKENTND